MKCEFCGTEFSATAMECPKCKARVQLYCQGCGALTPAAEIKCTSCGAARPTEHVTDLQPEIRMVAKPPFLATILRFFGVLIFLGMIVGILVLISPPSGKDVPIYGLVTGLVLMALCFGLAQVIDIIHATALRVDELYRKLGQR